MNVSQIKTVGVVGAGTMGIGICEVAAAHGQTVKLFDVNVDFAQQSVEKMATRLDKRVAKGKISAQDKTDLLDRITVVDSLDAFADVDLVVEAIIENIEIKQQLFQQLEEICSSKTFLSSNTSSISITAIAAGMKQPERLFGLHFFNPAPVMKLVEVISGLLTDPAHLQTGKALCEFWGKVPVIANSSPGFIVNRVARSFYGEPLKMMQEQLADAKTMDAVMTQSAGFRMGPFALMDLIGIDINYSVSQSVYGAMYNDPRFRPSLIQAEMVAAGTLGRKSGRGFYPYGDDQTTTSVEYEPVADAPQAITLPVDLGVLEGLFSGMDETDINVLPGEDIQVGNCMVLLTEGAKAADVQQYFAGHEDSGGGLSVALVDWSFDYSNASAVNVTFSGGVSDSDRSAVVGLFQALGKDVLTCPDQPGMVAMRTMVMLINEAADAVFNGVCSSEDVDLAMRYGVNYPKGLLAFADEMGWAWVDGALSNLQRWFGDDRYRRSPYIQNQLQVR